MLASRHRLSCLLLSSILEDVLWVALKAAGLIILALVLLLRVVDLFTFVSAYCLE